MKNMPNLLMHSNRNAVRVRWTCAANVLTRFRQSKLLVPVAIRDISLFVVAPNLRYEQ